MNERENEEDWEIRMRKKGERERKIIDRNREREEEIIERKRSERKEFLMKTFRDLKFMPILFESE